MMTGEERITKLINITQILQNELRNIAGQQGSIENLETDLAAVVFVTQDVYGKKYQDARRDLEPTVKKRYSATRDSIHKDAKEIDILLNILK